MNNQVFLVSPVPPFIGTEKTAFQNKIKSSTLRVGLLDNGKFNAAAWLDSIAKRLHACTDISGIIKERKASMSSAASPAALERLAKQSDLVISAMAD